MVRRPLYMDRLTDFAGADVVKVLTGVRRCGKSTLLKQLKNDLVEEGIDPACIVSVDFELPSNMELTDAQAFIEHVSERAASTGPLYLFVDEVQELQDWAYVINGIRAEYGADIYVTGSNARMFSGEKMTYLSGRYIELNVYPLSLAEYCQFVGIDVTSRMAVTEAYGAYTREGALPAVALASSEALKNALLDGIYDSVFMRDIVLRGRIRDEAAFMRVASFLLDNIGSQTSASAIANSLKASGHKVSTDTVDNYLSLMQKAHLIYRCDRYDIRGKERLRTNGKYYVVDLGLRNRVLGLKNSDRGHVTENLVYMELRRRGYDVFVGTLPDAEIDFVAQREGTKTYVQVSETVLDPQVLQREMAPFAKLKDGYPRILITKDESDYSQEGVVHVNLLDFLLGREL